MSARGGVLEEQFVGLEQIGCLEQFSRLEKVRVRVAECARRGVLEEQFGRIE